MNIKLTTLIENHENTALNLAGEHGLSILIESKSDSVLFDTGQTGTFIDNAKKLNVNLSKVNNIVLSHGHFDHSGGLVRFIKDIKSNINIFLGKDYFVPKYMFPNEETYKLGKNLLLADSTYQFIGNSFTKEELKQFVDGEIFELKNEIRQIAENIYVVNGFPMMTDYEILNTEMFKKRKKYVIDSFDDEVALVLKIRKGIIIILGCSHRGPINMIKSIQKEFQLPVVAVIGGTHLIAANQERVDKTIRDLKALDLDMLAASHCTGEENIDRLEREFKDKFILNGTGTVIEF